MGTGNKEKTRERVELQYYTSDSLPEVLIRKALREGKIGKWVSPPARFAKTLGQSLPRLVAEDTGGARVESAVAESLI